MEPDQPQPLDPLRQLLQRIEIRLRRKRRRAEDATVEAARLPVPNNCCHRGSPLGVDGLWVCRIRCLGSNEAEAGLCHAAKARICPGFTPHRTDTQLREYFRSLPEEVVRVRWPSIGELEWAKRATTEALLGSTGDHDG